MDHIKAIIIKLVMITVVLGIILTGIYDGEFSNTFAISIVLTLLAYIIGDLMIFRKAGEDSNYTKRNTIATISDIVLTFAVIFLMGKYLYVGEDNLFSAALLSAVVVGIGEWFFHKYLNNNVFDEKPNHHRTIH
jgi:F0F1-type ATP synthase assembly protein I